MSFSYHAKFFMGLQSDTLSLNEQKANELVMKTFAAFKKQIYNKDFANDVFDNLGYGWAPTAGLDLVKAPIFNNSKDLSGFRGGFYAYQEPSEDAKDYVLFAGLVSDWELMKTHDIDIWLKDIEKLCKKKFKDIVIDNMQMKAVVKYKKKLVFFTKANK